MPQAPSARSRIPENATAYDELIRLMAGTNIFSAMNKKYQKEINDAVSPVIAVILLVALTVVVCGGVAIIAMPFVNQGNELPPLPSEILEMKSGSDILPHEILAIQVIKHKNDDGSGTLVSNITVQNIGKVFIDNSKYKPVIYIENVQLILLNNDGPPKTEVNRLSARGLGTNFSSISGDGPNGATWAPGEIGYFDLTNGKIGYGKTVQVDIVSNTDKTVIFSRSIKKAPSA